MDMITGLISGMPGWLHIAITVLSASLTAITALTPSKSDDKIVNTILKVMNMFAGNIGKNKNADSE